MRRLLALIVVTLSLVIALPAQAGVGSTIGVDDFEYLPDAKTAPQPTGAYYLVFQNAGSFGHTATQDAGMFDTSTIAPDAQVQVSVGGSGTYPYHCEVHPDLMHGVFRLRPVVDDATVSVGDTVTVQVGAEFLKGPVFDVQRRRNGGDWVLVRDEIFDGSPTFTMNRVGTYEFRARTRTAFTASKSQWSPVRKVVVS